MTLALYYLTATLYLASTIGYLAHLVWLRRILGRYSLLVLGIGFASQTAYLVARYVETGFTPVTTRLDASGAFAWLIVATYLAIQIRQAMPVLGAFVTPLALILTLTAAMWNKTFSPLDSILRSPWLPIHAILAFLGDALLGVSACFALMYILQERQLKSKRPGAFSHRLPPLDVLDRYSYRCITVGFPLLTLGIISGALWLKAVEGSYIKWQDGRQTTTVLAWFLYAALLHGRLVTGWRGKRVALLNLAGFVVILVTFVTLSHFMK